MTKPPFNISPIFAVITSAGSPTDYRPAGDHAYVGIITTADGRSTEGPIGKSSSNFWPLPLLTRPLPVGHVISGYRVNGINQWDYIEIPKFGPCPSNATAPFPVLGGGNMLLAQIMAASPEERAQIRKALFEE